MAKLFETTEDYVELIHDQFDKTGLGPMGINLKVLSISKQKELIKVSKTSATTAFLTHNDIQLTLYEEAFERLPKDMQIRLVETALSNVWYDSDKDKLNVETNPFIQIFNMRKKYPTIVDDLETAHLTIKQLEDEEKERKAAEKEDKKTKRQEI